jgi:hypothetical protein
MDKETNNITRDNGRSSSTPLSLEGATKYLSCSGDLLEELIALGSFPVIRLGAEPGPGKRDRRKRWIDRIDVDRFIEGRKKPVDGGMRNEHA